MNLDDASKKKIDALKSAKADYFASDCKSMQVSAHKDAVSLFERYADKGENLALKTWATKTLPNLEHHLEMARALPEK